eukprot:2426267-Prymnesium_polylepis.1
MCGQRAVVWWRPAISRRPKRRGARPSDHLPGVVDKPPSGPRPPPGPSPPFPGPSPPWALAPPGACCAPLGRARLALALAIGVVARALVALVDARARAPRLGQLLARVGARRAAGLLHPRLVVARRVAPLPY